MRKTKSISKKTHKKLESRIELCSRLIRNARFWYIVMALIVANFFSLVTLNEFRQNINAPKVYAYISTYLVPAVFFVSVFIMYKLPLSINSFFMLQKKQYAGLIIVFFSGICMLIFIRVAPNFLIYSIWLLFVLLPIIPFITAHRYIKLSNPYVIQLVKGEINKLSELMKSPYVMRKDKKNSIKRLSFYVNLIIGSADENLLEHYLAMYNKLTDIKSGQLEPSQTAGILDEMTGLISQHPLIFESKVDSYKSTTAKDINLCEKYDAGNFYLLLATHWVFPYLRIRKNYLQYLATHLTAGTKNGIENPKTQFEQKLNNDYSTFQSWKKNSESNIFFWQSIAIVFSGIFVSYYYTNIRLPEVYRIGIELFPSLANIGNPPPFPDIFLETYPSISINIFLYFFYFIPFAIVQLATLRLIEKISISQKPPILALNSRLFILSFFLTLYFPIWRIISERPTFYLELMIIYLLIGTGTFASFKYFASSYYQIKEMINISDSIVVVNLMDIYFAFQTNDPQVRKKKVSNAVKRTKHFLRFLKFQKKTNDRAANLMMNNFFDTFSNMLSLTVANNAIPSEKDRLSEEISKIIYACVMRNYRDIEKELPSSYRKALELLDLTQRRRERTYNIYLRPFLGILLTILVYVVIKLFASWMPGLMEFIGNLADIKDLFGF